MTGYNSHGHFTSLEEIIELEVERCNPVDPTLVRFASANKDKYLAIWVCLDPKDAIAYCSHNEQIGDGTIEDLSEVDLGDGILWTSMDDGSGGFLYLRKK